MNQQMQLWHDQFAMETFSFEERKAILVHPEKASGKWLLKTEYFDAFPDLELKMLSRGWTLAYLQNHNRWGTNDDLDAKERFHNLLVKRGFSDRCVPIGMSCGGLHAIKQAARHPDMISALYLDAPVVDLLSCPFGIHGSTSIDPSVKQEALDALGLTMEELPAYRDHPLDHLSALLQNRIPAALVCGGRDSTVPYEHNGIHVKNAYEASDVPFLFQFKPECDHHPHGPLEMETVISFLEQFD